MYDAAMCRDDTATSSSSTFKYDPFGRRIYKSSSAGTSIFAYDGDSLVEETNSSGTAVARYSQTQNIDELLAMLRSGATSYYSHLSSPDSRRSFGSSNSRRVGPRSNNLWDRISPSVVYLCLYQEWRRFWSSSNRAREKATVLSFERGDTACRGKNHLSPPKLSKPSSLNWRNDVFA